MDITVEILAIFKPAKITSVRMYACVCVSAPEALYN